MRAAIGEVWSIYVDQAPVLMPAAAAVFVATGIVSSVLSAGGSAAGLFAAEVIVVLAGTLFSGMVVELVADVQDGRRDARVGQLLRAAAPVLGKLILVGFLAAICIAIGLLAFVVPGLMLLTMWSVFVPVIVLERPPGLSALGRSRELVRGNGWRVFGVLLVLVVLVGMVSLGIESAAASAGSAVGIVAWVLVGVLSAPFSALGAAVLYFRLRGPSAREPAIVGAPESG